MSKLRGLQLATEVATRQRDDVQVKLTGVRRNASFAEGQMEQLKSYAADKDAGWTSGVLGARSGELVRHHYQFMDRLQHAIGLQTGVIANVDQQVLALQRALVAAEVRIAALQQLVASRQSDIEKLKHRVEQTRSDEYASQQYARARAENQFGEPHGY